ncbi:MAG: DUF4293 domain-containing protein [Prevotellaceae bacterium]|jgi:hypothetical protein|nr:DUF4293 domain-containing protein [Prevotellaceae bacterium]
MIQRIQTLFLLVAAGLLTAMLFAPFANCADHYIYYTTFRTMFALLVVSLAVTCITIFLYRRRVWQKRLCLVNGIVLLVLQGFVIYYMIATLWGAEFSFTTSFPTVAVIFTWLAGCYIRLDEAKIKALDRLR